MSRSTTIIHLDLPSTCIHQDSPEGVAQIEREKALGNILVVHDYNFQNISIVANKNRRKSVIEEKDKESEVQEENKKKKKVMSTITELYDNFPNP